jgi:hypothetical protein
VGAVVAAAVMVVLAVLTNDKSVSQLFSVAHRDGLSCFPIFSVRAVSGKCPLPPCFLSCLVLILVPFVPTFLVLSPTLTPLVVGRLSHPVRTHCASLFTFLVQDALPTNKFQIKCVWSIQGARCNRRMGFILCYFRNLSQFRMLLHMKWGTTKARVRKLNQGNVSTISRAAKYQSAQTVSISKQEPCTYRICSHQTDRYWTVPFMWENSLPGTEPSGLKNSSFGLCWRY